MSRIHWVTRGTGTSKDRDKVNRREVSECDGWVCDVDVMGTPSQLNVIRKDVSLVRTRSTLLLNCWTKTALTRSRPTLLFDLLRLFVYYESIKRGLKLRLIYEYRCDERLKTKNEESTLLSDTGLVVELEHLKRLIRKPSVLREYFQP